MPDAAGLTLLLENARAGGPGAQEALWNAVYHELHGLARAEMAREAAGRTLQPTALIHEAYVKLMEGAEPPLANRKYFFAAAGKAMRQILVDDARRRGRAKRGDGVRPQSLEGAAHPAAWDGDGDDLLALDEAMARLVREEPALVQVVELRYFAGLTEDQIANVMGVSPRTVSAYWLRARVRLREMMT